MDTLTRAAAVPSRKTRSRTLETKPSGKWAAKMVRNQGVAYSEGSASSLTNESRVLESLANERRVLPVQVAVEAGPCLRQQPRHGVEADLEAGHIGVELTPMIMFVSSKALKHLNLNLPEADREHERLE